MWIYTYRYTYKYAYTLAVFRLDGVSKRNRNNCYRGRKGFNVCLNPRSSASAMPGTRRPISPPSKILPLFFALFFQPNSSSARFCPPLPSSCFLLPRIRGSLLGWSSAREISPSRAAKNWKVAPVCRFLSKAVEVIAKLMHRKQGGGQSLFLQMCEKKEEKKKENSINFITESRNVSGNLFVVY